MRKIAALSVAALFIAFVTAGFSQSLSDLADKEKQRRQNIKTDSKVITNEQTDKWHSKPVTAPESAQSKEDQEQGKDAEAKAKTPKADPNEWVDFEGRSESYWRQTLAEARKKVKDLEVEADKLAMKATSLQGDYLQDGDVFRREGVTQREIQKNIYEQDLNKEKLEKARKELQDLESSARLNGVPPGVISGEGQK
jgi:hypothetical protein